MTAVEYEIFGIAIAVFGGLWGIFRYFSSQVQGIKKEYVRADMCKVIDKQRNGDIERLEKKLDDIYSLLLKIMNNRDEGACR